MSAPANTKKRRSWLGLLIPALLAFAVLVALGTWQIQRKAWKEGLIATLTERLAAPPVAVPTPNRWANLDQATDEYRRVKFTATFDNGKEALVYAAASSFRPDVSGRGYWVFTPARLAGGAYVMVNRGFVPEARKDGRCAAGRPDRGPDRDRRGDCAGRTPTTGSPPPTIRRITFGSRAIRGRSPMPRALAMRRRSMSSRKSPVPPGGLPKPGKLVVRLRNEHLGYALTWYGLALVLAASFAAWALKSTGERS